MLFLLTVLSLLPVLEVIPTKSQLLWAKWKKKREKKRERNIPRLECRALQAPGNCFDISTIFMYVFSRFISPNSRRQSRTQTFERCSKYVQATVTSEFTRVEKSERNPPHA